MRIVPGTRHHASLVCGAVIAVLAFLLVDTALTKHAIQVPQGTVVELRMESDLSSSTAQPGDRFRSTVSRAVAIDGQIAIPQGTTVEGEVTVAREAGRGESGVIGVEFTRMVFPNGSSFNISGVLTSLNPEERRQILEEEGQIRGQGTRERTIVFIGGGAGLGAVVGAIAGGGKGALIGAIAGGVLGGLLSEGKEADVKAGTPIAMELTAPITVESESEFLRAAQTDRTIYTSPATVRAAQTELRRRGYYDGEIHGRLDSRTRRALANYQIDRKQTASGDLDHETALSLGLDSTLRAQTGSGSLPAASTRDQLEAARDLTSQARHLLEEAERRIGVHVADISLGLRRDRGIRESDLEMLLDLDAFLTAAAWYEQAAEAGMGGSDLSSVEGVLMRASNDVQSHSGRMDNDLRREWTVVQASLQDLGLKTGTAGRVDTTTGELHWQGMVDGIENIIVQGSSVSLQHVRGRRVTSERFNLEAPLSAQTRTVSVQKLRGRGDVRVLEHPNRNNGYRAVVQINDTPAGAGWYEIVLNW
ncbi:MAG: peptidoglycan-binding protein [Acidobacteria bacterium]|nr:peptidoglycan-binding protein [Acidobacteriota bacterium]